MKLNRRDCFCFGFSIKQSRENNLKLNVACIKANEGAYELYYSSGSYTTQNIISNDLLFMIILYDYFLHYRN